MRILKKGQEEGVSLQVLQTILARIMEFPNRNIDRATHLMKKHLEKYEKILLRCVSSHFKFPDQFSHRNFRKWN